MNDRRKLLIEAAMTLSLPVSWLLIAAFVTGVLRPPTYVIAFVAAYAGSTIVAIPEIIELWKWNRYHGRV